MWWAQSWEKSPGPNLKRYVGHGQDSDFIPTVMGVLEGVTQEMLDLIKVLNNHPGCCVETRLGAQGEKQGDWSGG